MRFLVWTCRVIMVVVVAAFVATVFSMTHDVNMESVTFTLGLITVIGASLVGLLWPLMRRYWQALFLLAALGVFRGLFGHPGLASLQTELVTPLQADLLWIPIGVIVLALTVTLVWRAIASERALKAIKQAAAGGAATKPAAVEPSVAPPASEVTSETQTAADKPAASEEPAAAKDAPADKK